MLEDISNNNFIPTQWAYFRSPFPSEFAIRSNTVDTTEPQAYKIYLPLILNAPLFEVDAPSCRWPRTTENFVEITYKWGSDLQIPGSTWRIAFEAALSDWSNLQTNVYYRYSIFSSTVINNYEADDHYGGYAVPHCNGVITSRYDIFGNTFYDHTPNVNHAYAGHETGHGQSLGHISNQGIISLLGYNPDANVYYFPQDTDRDFVNMIYP